MSDQISSGVVEGKGLLETVLDTLRLAECTARHQQECIESLSRRVEALEQVQGHDSGEPKSVVQRACACHAEPKVDSGEKTS